MASSVAIEHLSKSYRKGCPVLNDLSLQVQEGELFFLLGPSGCGKSTLLRILAGLVEPSAGRILFSGEDVTQLPPEKRQAVMVFQNYALWPHLTVFENVAFGLRAAGEKEAVIREKVQEALSVVRMQDFTDRKVPSLSGGQQQRVALARAIAVSPRVLLLDEPLSNLDAKLRDEMRLEISRICHKRNLTAIYVTHDRREALSMGDRIALLDRGVIQQTGSPVELYRHPRNRFAASFLGGVNFLSAKKNSSGVFENPDCGVIRSEGKIPDGEKALFLIRPEAFSLKGDPAKDNVFDVLYESGTFLGERSELRFTTKSGQLIEVIGSAYEAFESGKKYRLFAEPSSVTSVEE